MIAATLWKVHSHIAPSTYLLLPLILAKNFNLSASNFDDWLNGNNDIHLLPNHQRILILLLRLCFDNEGRKNFYGILRRVENIIFEAENEKNTRTEDLKTVLPAAVLPGINLDLTHQKVQLYFYIIIFTIKIWPLVNDKIILISI